MGYKKLFVAFIVMVIATALGANVLFAYWLLFQPPQDLESKTIDVVVQTFGTSTVVKVPQLQKLSQGFHVYTSVINLAGEEVFRTPMVYVKGTKFSVLTYSQLPIGRYNVLLNVVYQLNPVREVSDSFPVATIYVLGGSYDR